MDVSQFALISIVVHLVCIAAAWWALSAVHFDKFISANKVVQARLLYIMLAIALGSAVSTFLLNYYQLGSLVSQLGG